MDNNSSRDGSFNDHRDCPVGWSDYARREYEITSRVLGVLLFPSCTPENIQLKLNNELISGMNKPLLCALLCFDSNALILRSPRHDAHFDDNYCKKQNISPVRCDFTVACKIVPKETRKKTTVNSSHFFVKFVTFPTFYYVYCLEKSSLTKLFKKTLRFIYTDFVVKYYFVNNIYSNDTTNNILLNGFAERNVQISILVLSLLVNFGFA